MEKKSSIPYAPYLYIVYFENVHHLGKPNKFGIPNGMVEHEAKFIE